MKTGFPAVATKTTVFLFPVLVCAVMIYFKSDHHGLFKQSLKEDGFFEYFTFANYLVAAVVAAIMALMARGRGPSHLVFGYGLFSLIFFIFAGEEISWGQRIFSIPLPEFFREHSFQYEINVHNLRVIREFDYFLAAKVSILLGLYGAFGWISVAGLRSLGFTTFHRLLIPYLVPRIYQTSYFLLTALYFSYTAFLFPRYQFLNVRRIEQELMEFILSVGFLVFVVHNTLHWYANSRMTESVGEPRGPQNSY